MTYTDAVDEDHTRYMAEQLMDSLTDIHRALADRPPAHIADQLAMDEEAVLDQLASLGFEQ